ncbi:DNA-binding transcriptional regulator, MurR/RpiR family, contains HTH and SIS domains [Saccharopolyspora antimicrobica]|uniref:DNA-binding transcriptional regulator, MurR/RpiR family, contains HTH and SIS domains n=1 Tax=Saccharopolyspora antimicrobica TaxID=455193 RepID=A0A1I5FZJ0_9PSEU|nr:MurR/RpiR family transcriptional regulator [Saccharopolyspora antimicrobica]RKT84001.1 RpiR family transcriptional regulator [Saccharopolyspora antimicrobica]SFO29185.1 DNA-binding transcriptional regulator, MurR/RpiR family, contains HTH and SIS domains [Saccharopolyspora antimicrobica]
MASDDTSRESGEASPLVKIRSLLPGLARAEQRVANIVLADPASISRRSITEVAEAAGTSETTVTRFCKAIGVGGYPDLRIALAADTARTSTRDRELGSDIAPDDDLGQIIEKVGYADAKAVEETADQLDAAVLEPLVEDVAQARRIDVYGVGASAFVALDLQQKLHRIGLTCFAWSDTHNALTSAAVLREGDVAIGISHTGATAETVEALREARRRGATTAALTNFARSPITEVADHVLTTAVRETTYRSGAMASRIGQLTVIDCLFIGVAQRHLDQARAALEATYEAVGGHRLESRPDRRRQKEA